MSVEEFKKEYPACYFRVVEQERERIAAWLKFYNTDAELVTSAIKEGKTLTATLNSELTVKMFTQGSGISSEQRAKDKSVLDFRNEARATLGLPVLT